MKVREAQLASYTKQKGLTRRRDREQVYGFDRRISAEAVGANKRMQKALAQKAEDDKIKAEIKKTGIRGEISLQPERMDVSGFSFDDAHINKDRGHQVTRAEAEQFIHDAKFSVTRWNGKFTNYYGTEGAAYVDNENKQIKTAFKRDQFDEKTKAAMEVMKKHERT